MTDQSHMNNPTYDQAIAFEHGLRAYVASQTKILEDYLEIGGDSNASNPDITFEPCNGIWYVKHYRFSGAHTQGACLMTVVSVWGTRYLAQNKLSTLPALLSAPVRDE